MCTTTAPTGTSSCASAARASSSATCIALSAANVSVNGRALIDLPSLASTAQTIEERHRVECLWPEDARSVPHALGEKLERDDGIDGGLPHDGLRAVTRHRLVVVGAVEQVHLSLCALRSGAGHPCSRTRASVHAIAETRRVGQRRGNDVTR